MASADTIGIYRGEDVVLTFTMTPVEDITGWDLLFTLRYSAVSFTKTGVVTDAVNGVFTVTIADTDTESLSVGLYTYDIWRVDPGVERVVAIGLFNLTEVVRAL